MPEQGRMASRDHAPSASGVRDCERCAELSERVAWLESELGLQEEAHQYEKLRRVFRAFPRNGGRSQAARFALALYRTGGRPATRWQLMEATQRDPGSDDDRSPKIIDVWVCFARRVLGADSIETVWGTGYRMTDAGRAKVAAIIGAPNRAEAA